MKRKFFIAGCLIAISGGVAVWLVASSPLKRPGSEIPVKLVGYTNDVTGILTARYKDTNVAHSRFAVFHIQNPTRRDFFCYIGPVFWDDGQIDTRSSQSGDFDLPPGADATFAVAVPNISKAWRCGVVLSHRYSYPRWKFELVRFAERCGLNRSEPTWFAVSPEIAQ